MNNVGLGEFGLTLSYGSVAVTVKKEVYNYDFVSMVSDFGGSLGLFVGFSFFALWDYIKDCAFSFHKHVKKC